MLGHDNYFDQSYPMIVKKRMQDIFAALGVKLTVRNIAMAANGCIPYMFCYETMGGDDPDFIGWEQSYNCGRDEKVFELAARSATWSRNRAIVYFSASGAWSPDKCPPSEAHPPFSDENWTPESAGKILVENSVKKYLKFTKLSFAFEDLQDWDASSSEIEQEKNFLFKYNEGQASYNKFAGFFRRDYLGSVIHGFNVWENNPHCSYLNKQNKSATGCNGIDAAMECRAMKFMTSEAAQYGAEKGGAKWHPTRAFHMLRGEKDDHLSFIQ